MAHTRDASSSQQHRDAGGGDRGGAGAEMRNAAAEAADATKDRAREMADDIKARGTDQISGVSGAIHEAADHLGKELPQAAHYIHSAAHQRDSASTALRERSIEDLISGFSSFARRQPAAAFAGAVLAGFA